MKSVSNYVIVLLLLLGGCRSSKTAEKINSSGTGYAVADKLDTLFLNSMERQEFAGAVCLISEKGRIVYHDLSSKRRVQTEF